MSNIVTIGLDIAKSVFQVHAVDSSGEVVVRRKLTRGRVLAFFESLPRCVIGIEACSSSHYGVRTRAVQNPALSSNELRTSCRSQELARDAQRSEAFRHLLFGVPGIDASEIYVLPTERRDVLEQIVRNMPALLPQMGSGTAEIDGVPVDDGADDQIEAGGPECLAVKGAVADFAALVEEDGALELVGGFALVETGLTAPAQRRARIPLNHEQGSLDTTDLAKRFGQIAGFR